MSNDFTTYLIKNGFVAKTRQRMLYCSNHYQTWLTERNINTEEASYKDLLNYIGDLQKEKSKPVINEHLRAVSHYNKYLQIPDIAYQERVRGIEKPQQILFTEDELNRIYESYEPQAQKGFWRNSDKILLGFIIYQALDERDILRIELEHLQLAKGEIKIPAGQKRKEARTLKLEAFQILQLHNYIENYRDKNGTKLISPQAEKFDNLHDQITNLNRQIRKLGETLQMDIRRLSQLKQSRITLWIKQYGLRKTQYYGGFKRVENVERYRQQDSEDLQQYVLEFHPLK
ncbi:MAG: site-specific integrase [Saprospiraceae bacterium]|nr:site-specific integrase [Saprospiraceae bacterium]